jgi:hypothetical protein
LLQKSTLSIQTLTRNAGILLVSSFLVLLLALIIMIASGALPGFSANLQGSLAEMAPYVSIFRRLDFLWIVGWILHLLGFSLLVHLLLKAGEDQLAILPFVAIFVATMLGVLHGTFHMSVGTWAAEEAALTGSIPEIYEPLENWVSSSFRIGYYLHLAAVACFGWGILRANLLAPWVGRAAIGWSVLWLVGGLVGIGAPGILFIMPTVIGAALLMQSSKKSV